MELQGGEEGHYKGVCSIPVQSGEDTFGVQPQEYSQVLYIVFELMHCCENAIWRIFFLKDQEDIFMIYIREIHLHTSCPALT